MNIGSGTGYLTMVAANLMGHTGKAVGLEATLCGTTILFLRLKTLHFVMALTFCQDWSTQQSNGNRQIMSKMMAQKLQARPC